MESGALFTFFMPDFYKKNLENQFFLLISAIGIPVVSKGFWFKTPIQVSFSMNNTSKFFWFFRTGIKADAEENQNGIGLFYSLIPHRMQKRNTRVRLYGLLPKSLSNLHNTRKSRYKFETEIISKLSKRACGLP